MAYHTAVYLFLFLPLVLLAYQLTPKKSRWVTLLAAGYLFFWLISGELLVYLIGTTLFVHYISLWLDRLKTEAGRRKDEKNLRKQYRRKERLVLAVGIGTLLSVLAYLKYYNFFVKNANGLLTLLGVAGDWQEKSLILPIGISFYTLQAIGYLADVYWGKFQAETHPGKLALFLGFFPQIMEGPISRYDQTADILWEGNALQGTHLAAGGIRIVWGLFKKLVIADRLYPLVQEVFDQYEQYGGVVVAAAAIAYTVQLYMEFSGCMDMVIGSGRLFGVCLPENFRQPFAAEDAAEFWRRWHMTLGVWLKTYVFYPVSVSGLVKRWNHFGKQKLGKHWTKVGVSAIALFPVWLFNGLWHGPRWSYIFYGMYYFTILLCGIAAEPLRKKVLRACHIREEAWYWKGLRMLKTWVIVCVGELFFRSHGLKIGMKMFRSIFESFDIRNLWDGTFLNFGLDLADYLAVGAGCAVVALVGIIKERKLIRDGGLETLQTPLRWAVYYGLILAVVVFGAYGIGYQQVDLIYAGF